MTDILFVVVLVAFFALAVVFVRACERIIGADTEVTELEEDTEQSPVAA